MKKIAIILTFFITFYANAKDNLVSPGIGVATLFIGNLYPTDHKRREYADKGVFFSGSDEIINSIWIESSMYETKEGIKIGDSLERVLQVFGKKKSVELSWLKGGVKKANMSEAIAYEGITFTINNNYVSSIIISKYPLPKQNQGE